MPTWLAILIGCASLAVALVTLGGVAWKYLVLPNLREQLIKPVQETHRATTVNGGQNNPATLLDKVGDLKDGLKELRDDFHAHITLAQREEAAMWSAIEAIAKSSPPTDA